MMYVAAISIVFLAAGLAMLSKLGTGNSAALEVAAARSYAGRQVRLAENEESRNVYMRQFDEAVASYR